MIRMRLIDCDNSKMTEISLSGRGRNASARLIKMKGEKDALAAENRKLKDKIAKMREMLK